MVFCKALPKKTKHRPMKSPGFRHIFKNESSPVATDKYSFGVRQMNEC